MVTNEPTQETRTRTRVWNVDLHVSLKGSALELNEEW